ncbi:MAG: anaerobic ribonucleoside-triphosphate reductase [Promethearchaeia archaeon]
MESDKITTVLEKQFKTLGQKIRIDILKILNNHKNPISFSQLKKDIEELNYFGVNLSFHLKSLLNVNLISSESGYYSLTSMGIEILKHVLSIEQVLNNQHRVLMIRTSKYSKEPFDIHKIEEYLIKEGELELYLARTIANQVKERLMKTNIEYLTAPLLREYINGILIENGLEDVRKKLTRLGTPPSEVFKLFNSKENDEISPQRFINILGSDVSEQFLLLNLLPTKLADAYLSGEIKLLHLNFWSLRPLCLTTNSFFFNELVDKKIKNLFGQSTLYNDIKKILEFFKLIKKFSLFFSEGIFLSDFNRFFDNLCNNNEINTLKEIFNIFWFEYYNSFYLNGDLSIPFRFSFYKNRENLLVFIEFLLSLLNINQNFNYNLISPIITDVSFFNTDIFRDFINSGKFIKSPLPRKMIFINSKNSEITPLLLKTRSSSKNNIILDKIFVNLPMVANLSNQDDTTFLEILEEKVKLIFDFFSKKKEFLLQKLNNLKIWQEISENVCGLKSKSCIENSIKVISFFGLDEAITIHCGIELDRVKASEKFAFTILKTIKDIIREENSLKNENYCLSAPHAEIDFKSSLCKKGSELIKNLEQDGYRIIRKKSNLSLNKKMAIYNKFNEILEGNSVFVANFPENLENFYELISKMINLKINAFRII